MNLNRRISRKMRNAGSHLSLEHLYHSTVQLCPGGHLIRSGVRVKSFRALRAVWLGKGALICT
jgi:hypothetical protein